MVESPDFPGLLLPRTIDDPPPYYKVYPEGVIENFDGANVPTPHFLSDNQTDLNRNFPFYWAPDSKQEGAGAFPLSEVESRSVVEFTAQHPEIFAAQTGRMNVTAFFACRAHKVPSIVIQVLAHRDRRQ